MLGRGGREGMGCQTFTKKKKKKKMNFCHTCSYIVLVHVHCTYLYIYMHMSVCRDVQVQLCSVFKYSSICTSHRKENLTIIYY